MPIPLSAAAPLTADERQRHHRNLIALGGVGDEAEHPSNEASMDAADTDDEITPQDLATRIANGWLRDQRFSLSRNLVGGINRWSREVDPSTRRD